MKTIITTIFILISSIGYSQCNLTQINTSLASIRTNCGNFQLDGKVTNSYTSYSTCGGINFTPPGTTNPNATSVYEISHTNDILYPNPFRHKLSLQLESKGIYKAAEIVDLMGRLLYNSTLDPNKVIQEFELSDLEPGTYFMRLTTNDYKAKYYKIIKL